MEKMLNDKVAIITGSGRGIGRAVALLFAQEGAKVVVSDIDAEPAEETAADIKRAGGDSMAYVGDVTVPDFAPGIVKAAADNWGAVHVIVNNAGFTWDALIHKMTEEQWDFLQAMNEYKRVNNRPFPTWSEVLDVLRAIGYRKVAEPSDIE